MIRSRILFSLLLLLAAPAVAHHPGERLDEVMAQREGAFEPTDLLKLPPLAVLDVEGDVFELKDLWERIVVLSFVPAGCGVSCIEQQALLREVQTTVNDTPMRDMVAFLAVGDVSGPETGREPGNRHIATPRTGTAARSAEAFARLSARGSIEPMAHVIDRGGRHAGIFHGTGFARLSMVLYINGLTNAPPPVTNPRVDFWGYLPRKLWKSLHNA